jgi:hypothetical protein
MKEHPILFSGEMVRAILDGRKTQTRRVIKGGHLWGNHMQSARPLEGAVWRIESSQLINEAVHGNPVAFVDVKCPYGQPGDGLWVQESFRVVAGCHDHPKFGEARKVRHMASDIKSDWLALPESHWHLPTSELRQKINPGRFMPRWASRINLDITGVRVKQVQDITEEDARAEGFNSRAKFLAEFAKIYGPENHWVWIVKFRRLP